MSVGTRLLVLVTGVSVALATSGNGFAQVAPIPSAASLSPAISGQPAPSGGIPVGPLIVYPGVDYSVAHDDNLFSSNINRRGSDRSVLSPYVKIEGKPGPHKFDLTFRVDDGRFASSSADNYTDHSLLGNADLVVSGRAGLKLRGEYRYGHDARGSTDRAATSTPDEYINQGINGIFAYGAPGAKGRIEIDGGAFSRRYQNNRATTATSDRDTTQLGGTFLWRIAPKTELLGLVQRTRINYIEVASTQDSTEIRYQVGAKWEATAKTAGIVKFGLLDKKFDTGVGRLNYRGSSWDAAVRWSPLTYSVWDFNTSRSTNESTGAGDFLLTQLYGANWNHAWNSRFATGVNAGWREDKFEGTGGGRIDKTANMGLKLTYQWQRWLHFTGEYTWTDRVSNPGTTSFTRNLLMFTIGATL